MKSSTVALRVAILFAFLSLNFTALAQQSAYDLLVKKDGTIMEVSIVEIKPDEIQYKKKDDTDGAIYGIAKSELLSAKLKNGETLTFTVTVDNFYDRNAPLPKAFTDPDRAPLYAALPPKNEFQEMILGLPSDKLEPQYRKYSAASKSGMSRGWVGLIAQLGINLVGAIIVSANTETDALGNVYYSDPKAARTGGFIQIGGTGIGLILSPAGFVKGAINGNKARYIRDEMRRRGVTYKVRR